MQRRRAIRLLGALAGVPALQRLSGSDLLALGTRVHERLAQQRGPAARVLTPAQYRTVELAAEHIIPRTDTPGASDARVADFVALMLADWYAPAERDRFTAGLGDLEARSVRAYRTRFADAPPADRLALLRALDTEADEQRRARGGDEHWFTTLKFLTVWGYYTSRPGMTRELAVELMPGRYDGNAHYAPGNPRAGDGQRGSGG